MGKFLVWVGIALAAWVFWRFVLVGRRRVREAAERGAEGAAGGADRASGGERLAAPETMMQCAVCGVHLPASEARFARGRVYCSDTHRDQGAGSVQDEPARRDGA